MAARLALIFTLYSYLREEPAHGPCLLLLLRRELVEDLLQRRLAHAILLPPTHALGEPQPTGEQEPGEGVADLDGEAALAGLELAEDMPKPVLLRQLVPAPAQTQPSANAPAWQGREGGESHRKFLSCCSMGTEPGNSSSIHSLSASDRSCTIHHCPTTAKPASASRVGDRLGIGCARRRTLRWG